MPSKVSSAQKNASTKTSHVAPDPVLYMGSGISPSSSQTLLINNPSGTDPVMLCLRQEKERARALSSDPEIKSCSLGFRK
jgi:hypothetical protein